MSAAAYETIRDEERNATILSNPELKEALLAVASDYDHAGSVDSKRLGYWARDHVDRIVDGRVLKKAETKAHGGAQLWIVAGVA